MGIFKDPNAIVQGAIALTTERLRALEKDVDHCLTAPYAPLPAIAYCFSTVDLLGALYKGDASRHANTTGQSYAYMVDFMKYTTDQATLLQKIFRHKVVHLAVSFPVIEYKSMMIGWKYFHHNPAKHLKLNKFPSTRVLKVTPSLNLNYDYEFVLGIKDFQEDIVNSVVSSGGYVTAVKSSTALQRNFETAVTQMYDPTD